MTSVCLLKWIPSDLGAAEKFFLQISALFREGHTDVSRFADTIFLDLPSEAEMKSFLWGVRGRVGAFFEAFERHSCDDRRWEPLLVSAFD